MNKTLHRLLLCSIIVVGFTLDSIKTGDEFNFWVSVLFWAVFIAALDLPEYLHHIKTTRGQTMNLATFDPLKSFATYAKKLRSFFKESELRPPLPTATALIKKLKASDINDVLKAYGLNESKLQTHYSNQEVHRIEAAILKIRRNLSKID